MTTDMRHGDVIAGMSSYDELDRELVDEEFAARYLERLCKVADRPDAEVRRDVLHAFMLDSLVPMTVDAQVCDGAVTLTGTVATKCERQDALYLAGLIPGVFGVIDGLTCSQPASSDHGDEAADTVAWCR